MEFEEIDKFHRFGEKLLKDGKADLCLELFQASSILETNPKLLAIAGLAAEKLQKFSLALSYFNKTIEMYPEYPPTYLYAIRVNEIMWDYIEAEKVLNDSLRLFPDDPFLLYAKAEYLLRHKQYEEGWKYWEYRTIRRSFCDVNKDIPVWDGSDLNGHILLVTGEQGLGDQIMFARWLPLLKGNVVCYLNPLFHLNNLKRLLSMISSSIPIYSTPEELAQVDKVDCWTAMGSLPLNLKQYVPILSTGYLPVVDANKFNRLPLPGKFKVGLCWQGSRKNSHNAFRSILFKELRPLLDIPGCTFYSLQKGERESGLINLCDTEKDLTDAATMISKLDLIITVDTAIAHLAGALGKPVWVFIGVPSDWRWGVLNTISSDWYSSSRSFWQTERGSWAGAIENVKNKLKEML